MAACFIKQYPVLFACVLLILGLPLPLSADNNPCNMNPARVLSVDFSIPHQPVINVILLDGPQDTILKRLKLNINFSLNKEGCINWQNPENRAMASALSVKADDIILINGIQESECVQVKRLNIQTRHNTLPDWTKLNDSSIIDNFMHISDPVSIIVVLKNPLYSDENQVSDPETIHQLQETFLATINRNEFVLETRMDNIPILSAKVTFNGLKYLVAHPMVDTIQKNIMMELH